MATICTVSGTILSPAEGVLSSAKVRATVPQPYLRSADGKFIADYYIESTVDGNGAWTMDLAETATDSKKVLFTIIYPTRGGYREKQYVATIPNSASANFNDIATEV